jgi:uncharacterized membrane protein YheB (UPF0754 family)
MMTSLSSISDFVIIPVVSALIGYVTNYIAVLMLFRPHSPRRILGLSLHGLVPRRQKEIAASLGAMIENNLFSQEDVRKALSGKDTADEAASFLNEQVDLFVQKLSGQNPMIGAFLQGPLLGQVKGMLGAQIAERFPAFIERVVQKAEGELNVKAIVQAKIEAFEMKKLEALIYEISARELRTIEVLGGVLGFIVGLFQLVIIKVVS